MQLIMRVSVISNHTVPVDLVPANAPSHSRLVGTGDCVDGGGEVQMTQCLQGATSRHRRVHGNLDVRLLQTAEDVAEVLQLLNGAGPVHVAVLPTRLLHRRDTVL